MKCINIMPNSVKPGDLINGHEWGWLKVIRRTTDYGETKILCNSAEGLKQMTYHRWEGFIEVIRP